MSAEETKEVYEQALVHDFPKDEVKPLSIIQKLMKQGLYLPYGFYEGDRRKAYAWLTKSSYNGMVLLDYLAVNREDRGNGIGSQCLQMLKASGIAPEGFIVEAENPDFALDAEQKKIREKRVHFYLRNGLWQTTLNTCVYGVEYLILVLGAVTDSQIVLHDLQKIYHVLLTDEKYKKHTRLEM
jgi:GNAT superfamily N-acetyltransferase